MSLPPRLAAETAALLVIDFQEKLLPAIFEHEACAGSARKLIEAARVLGLPVVATEQYPAGLGPTVTPIRSALGDAPIYSKTRFSACVCEVTEKLKAMGRPAVLVTGIEAHVCVQQSVLDLLREGYTPYVCADAISSRRAMDRDVAVERMRQAGAIVTTVESAIFEMLTEAGGERFKQVLRIVK